MTRIDIDPEQDGPSVLPDNDSLAEVLGRELGRVPLVSPDATREAALASVRALQRLASEAPAETQAVASALAALIGSLVELVDASDRRLIRLGLDLHDGALQDLASALLDLRLYKRQLAELLSGEPELDRITGRLDDIDARLNAVINEIRGLSHSYGAATAVHSLAPSLRSELESFENETGIITLLDLQGSYDALTHSQEIATLRFVQSALANVRQHSEATKVSVVVVSDELGLEAHVEDNGKGFEVESTLVAAAATGHLGLVSMNERVNLLSGDFQIESALGGPTRISMFLPAPPPSVARP